MLYAARNCAGVYGGCGRLTDNATALVEAVRDLVCVVDMPASLRALGLEEVLLPQIIQDALEDEVMANTPRTPSAGEMKGVLEGAL